MAQYGDNHIDIRTRGGQTLTFESEYGIVKMELRDPHDPEPRDVVWLDEHEINAVAAWFIGWAKATAERRADGATVKNPTSSWNPRTSGSLGS